MNIKFKTERLGKYLTKKRKWQGVPSVEVTENGRVYVAFYSGGKDEQLGNFCVLLAGNENDGFTEIAAADAGRFGRCFDPALWTDEKGRLWLFFATMPKMRTYAVICENPCDKPENLVWGKPFFVAEGIMLNKPLVTSGGEVLLPVSVWEKTLCEKTVKVCKKMKISPATANDGAYAVIYKNGSFKVGGRVRSYAPSYDEHMFLEKNGGNVEVYIRTTGEIEKAESADGGRTFSAPVKSGIKNPNSRFFIKKLRSGRVLLINHYNYKGRNNLTALLSEDDGKTFPYSLLLDERNKVSYPDCAEGKDGFLYIVYDRERGSKNQCEEKSAKEILLAKIKEEDILCGRLSEKSKLKIIVSKLS